MIPSSGTRPRRILAAAGQGLATGLQRLAAVNLQGYRGWPPFSTGAGRRSLGAGRRSLGAVRCSLVSWPLFYSGMAAVLQGLAVVL